jgi:hypothetical protein
MLTKICIPEQANGGKENNSKTGGQHKITTST